MLKLNTKPLLKTEFSCPRERNGSGVRLIA
jgi:hypothetical protein